MSIPSRASWYFLSSVVTAAISLLTLPLTTRRLGPEDYGLLALGGTIAGVGASLATLGAGVAVSRRWTASTAEERSLLASRLLLNAGVISIAWCGAWAVAFVLLRDDVTLLGRLPDTGFALALVASVLSPYWIIASEVVTVTARAALFALVGVAYAVVSASATLTSLFVFDLGTTSLFVGFFAASIVVFAAGAYVLGPELSLRRAFRGKVDLAQGTYLAAQASEDAYGLAERSSLSYFAGFTDLGLYSHAQRYQALLHQSTKAVGRAAWPVTLAEARELDGAFPTTLRTWAPVHVFATAAAVGLVALGEDVIALLTNDKFTNGWIYLAPLFVVVLLKLSGNAAMGTLFALAPARTVGRVGIASNLAAIATAVALVPVLEIWGAIAALLVQALAVRVSLPVLARRHRAVPFGDTYVILGVGVVLAVYAVRLTLVDGLGQSIALAAAGEVVLLAAGVRPLLDAWRRLAGGWRRPVAGY